jgi:hypothetical protein
MNWRSSANSLVLIGGVCRRVKDEDFVGSMWGYP